MVDATQPGGKNADNARRTIFASYDTTAAHFELLCDNAGLEVDYVRRIVKHYIDKGVVLPVRTVQMALRLGEPDDA